MESLPNLFHQLRPGCVLVAKDPSVENLQKTYALLDELSVESITDPALFQYILFPFKLTLQKQKSLKEEQEILCFQCLKNLIIKSLGTLVNEEIISWSFNMFSMFFGADKLLENKKNISEELKYAVTDMLFSLCETASSTNFSFFYQEKYLPLVGHMVSILIDFIENQKSRKLQLVSLKCLKFFGGYSLVGPTHRESAGKFMSSFLPGIAMMFNRLFTSSEHQTHKIVISSLQTFAQILCIVLNDKENVIDHNGKSLEALFSLDTNEASEEHKVSDDTRTLTTDRNKEWFQKTSENMAFVFKNILPVLMCHNHVKVRLEFVTFIEDIMMACMNTLILSVPEFLDSLVKLSCDHFDDVRMKSLLALDLATLQFQEKGYTKLKSLLDEKLYTEFLSLPRIMNSTNEDIKLAKVQVIKGYLQFYGDKLADVLNSFVHLEKFLMALLQVLQLDATSISLVEERTNLSRQALNPNTDVQVTNTFQRKHFKLFRDTKILLTIKSIIHLLAKHGDVNLLVDYLYEKCQQSTMYRAQSILMINEIVDSVKDCKEGDDLASVIEMLLSAYLEDTLWKLPITNQHLDFIKSSHISNSKGISLLQEEEADRLVSDAAKYIIPYETLHNNIQVICLLLEGISVFAQTLKTNFNILLAHALFPILEKVGSVNAAINCTAMECLNDIVIYCNYDSIADLILINSDYLINAVTMQFRHLTHGSAAPAVLCVVLKFCNRDLLPIISDAITDVFKALDEYQDEVAEDMLNVLKCLAIAVNKWYNATDDTSVHEEEKIDNIKNKESTSVHDDNTSVSSFFASYCKLYVEASGEVDEEQIEDDDYGESLDNAEENKEEDQREVPLHFKVIVMSLEKCISLVASNSNSVKYKALDVVYYCILALHKRENDLLPIIHKLWPAVIRRMKDTDQVIVMKALDAICMMVEHSGDFMRKRMSTEFIPHVIKFLEENNKTFTKHQSKYTQIHKVEEKLVRYLGDIVPTLDVSLELFCKVSTVCVGYFNCRLHSSIQQASFYALQKFYSYKPDVIWLLLQSIENTQDLTSPHSSLKTILLSFTSKQRSEFSDNVRKFIDTELIC